MNREFSRVLVADSASSISHKLNDALDELVYKHHGDGIDTSAGTVQVKVDNIVVLNLTSVNTEVYNIKVTIERIA